MLHRGTSRVVLLFGILVVAVALVWAFASNREKLSEPSGFGSSTVIEQVEIADGIGLHDVGAVADSASTGKEKKPTAANSEALTREGLELELKLNLSNEVGSPVDGTVWILARTTGLEERLSTGRYAFTSLFEDSLLAEEQSSDGEVVIPVQRSWMESPLVALAAAPGFAPQAITVHLGTLSNEIILVPVKPIAVQVVDTDGKPVANTACWLTPMFTDWRAGPDGWLARLALRGFMEQVATDGEGRAVFLTCYSSSRNSIKVFPEPPLAVGAASLCEPGQEVVVTCAFGFAVSGHFFDAETGGPIEGAFVIFTEDRVEGSRTLTSLVTAEDGSFRQEALPAAGAIYSVQARAEGYATQRQRIFHPQPLSSHSLDFFLHPAAGLTLKLRTTWGEPIVDSLVQLRLGRYNIETSFQTTSEMGVAQFPAVLQKETSYECLISIGGNFWALPDIVVQAGEDEVIVPNLSRIMKVAMPVDLPKDFSPTLFEWTSLANENQGMVDWKPGSPSPLLPSGVGCLAVMSIDGRRLEMVATLQDGVREQINFLNQPALLSFTWTGEEGALLSLRSNIAWDWFKLEEPISPGPIELELWQGTFALSIEGDGGPVSFPALRLGPGNTDLGDLGWRDSSGVAGHVFDTDGNPLANVEVNLFNLDLGPSGFASTDQGGSFAITGMAPGAYSLQVTGGKAYGGSVHEVQVEVFLAPGEGNRNLEIQLETDSNRYLEGRVGQGPPANSFAFAAAGGQAQMVDVLPSGDFLLPRPTTSKWIGVGLQERGHVLFTMKLVAAGTESLLLDAPSLRQTIHVVDEHGEPWNDARIYAYVAGASLGFHAMPDVDGSLLLEASPTAEANLQFRLADGRAFVYSLSDLLDLATLVIPRDAAWVRLDLANEKGNPIPGAAAMHYGVGDVFYGDGNGHLSLPSVAGSVPYLIMARGYLSMWSSARQDHQLILPTLFSGLSLHLPPEVVHAGTDHAIAWVQIESIDLPENAFAKGPLELAVHGSILDLPPLPAGQIEVQLFDANREIRSFKTLTVAPGSLVLEY